MANKRMFTKQIIDSDAFLDMPLSSQSLYFHLNMRADDDGFINNPKKIQRMIGASDDDLKILIGKRFVLTFQSGVIVIKHWRMHNTLKGDRYTPTQYTEELKSLVLKPNKSYTESFEAISCQNGTIVEANWNRIGTTDKKSIEEKSIDIEKKRGEAPPFDYQEVVDNFHRLCPRLPKIKTIDDSRRRTLRAWGNLQEIMNTFTKAGQSDFMAGVNDRKWVASFDWIIQPKNRLKILEGTYDNRGKPKDHNVTPFNDYEQRNYDYDSLEKSLLGMGEE